MPYILVREGEIREGNAAMYYPRAKVLVPARVDAASKTPAFKNVCGPHREEPTARPRWNGKEIDANKGIRPNRRPTFPFPAKRKPSRW